MKQGLNIEWDVVQYQNGAGLHCRLQSILSRMKMVPLQTSRTVQHTFCCLNCFSICYIKISDNGRILHQISAWCPMTAVILCWLFTKSSFHFVCVFQFRVISIEQSQMTLSTTFKDPHNQKNLSGDQKAS